MIVGENAHHLGHAPNLDHGKAEALLEFGVQLRLDAGAETEADAVAAIVLGGRLAEQERRNDAEVMGDGRARLSHFLPPALRREAIGLDGPMSRKTMSFANEGRLPSMAWPMNCPIHATTKISRQVCHSGHASASSQRTTNNIAMSPIAAPIPRRTDSEK
jgi:hypothetical protein